MVGQETKNHYELLGVSQDASVDDIRKAYRKLAKLYHPDKTGGDTKAEDKLKEINSAYDVLKNAEKRNEYDQQLKYGSGFGGFSGGGFDPRGGETDYSDIFSSFFNQGGQRQQRRPQNAPVRGRDLQAHVNIELKDVLTGTAKTLKLNRNESCSECSGSGNQPGTSSETCPDCHGMGELQQGNGLFSVSQTCPRCHGEGQVNPNPCTRCRGHGLTHGQKTIQVSVPKGIQEGARLRVTGEGDGGRRGGPSGDLYVVVQISPDPFFTRDDSQVICEVPITFANAALGGKVEVPTLTGTAKVTVPEGTQNAAQLRLKGQGLPKSTGARGDQIVQILVEIPRKLSKKQKELIGEFSDEPIPQSHPLIEAFKSLLERFRK
jgi:molecular chaperone DnaJ